MVEARVLPQLGGQLNAALLVRGDLDGGGVEHTADLAALDEALFLNFGGDLFELLRREGGQAVIQPPGHDEGLPHRVPEAGGKVQTPFCIDCVIILTDEHPASPSLRHTAQIFGKIFYVAAFSLLITLWRTWKTTHSSPLLLLFTPQLPTCGKIIVPFYSAKSKGRRGKTAP